MSCVQHATRSALEMVQRWPLARAMGAGELVLLQVNACTLGGGDGADERAEWPTCRAKVSPRTLCAAPARPAEQLWRNCVSYFFSLPKSRCLLVVSK